MTRLVEIVLRGAGICLALAGFILAGGHALAEEDYSVDQDAYVARVKAELAQFFQEYDFQPSKTCIQLRGIEVCEKYLAILKDMNFTVIPPIEWSDIDPYLPATREMRNQCPNVGFEKGEIILKSSWDRGIRVAGRANFGLYRISDYVDAPEVIYAYRSEDQYTLYEGVSPSEQKMMGSGFIEVFAYPSCHKYSGQPISKRYLHRLSGRHIHEFIIHEGNLFFLKVISLGDEGGKKEEAFRMLIQKYKKSLKALDEFYPYVTYK